jgi:hypothetical protein
MNGSWFSQSSARGGRARGGEEQVREAREFGQRGRGMVERPVRGRVVFERGANV